jgi:hypothetical protein
LHWTFNGPTQTASFCIRRYIRIGISFVQGFRSIAFEFHTDSDRPEVGHIAAEESAKMGVAEWILIMVVIWAFWYCRRKPG